MRNSIKKISASLFLLNVSVFTLFAQSSTTETEDDSSAILIYGGFVALGILFFTLAIYRRKKLMYGNENPYLGFLEINLPVDKTQLGCISFLFFPFNLIYFIVMAGVKKKFKKERIVCEGCKSSNISVSKGKEIERTASEYTVIKEFTFLCKDCGYEHKESVKFVNKPSNRNDDDDYDDYDDYDD